MPRCWGPAADQLGPIHRLRGTSYDRLVFACGVVGTALALVGIADRPIAFLVLLG